MLFLCFTLFQHNDLLHTVQSSYAYLDGHFLDFYDYNASTALSGNDYFPTIYIVFALWNLPLKILGLITSPSLSNISNIEIVWSKLLLIFLFFSLILILYKITKLLTDKNREQSRITAVVFGTAPIAIFAIFIFGQYDIIGLLLTLIGFYYYLKKDLNRFAFFFSWAISCKLFYTAIFFPLLLLVEKRPYYLFKYTVIALLVPLIQVAEYLGNSAFRHHIFSLPASKIHGVTTQKHGIFLILCYLVLCIYAFIYKPINEKDFQIKSVFIPITAFALFFSAINWHPQWLIIITPFFALSTIYIKQKDLFYLIDLVGMLSFICIISANFPDNVDSNMLKNGLLKNLFLVKPLLLSDLIPKSFVMISNSLFGIYLFSPLLMLIFQTKYTISTSNLKTNSCYLWARFTGGIFAFVLPALLCALLPALHFQTIVGYLDPNYYIKTLKHSIPGKNTSLQPIGEIIEGAAISQSVHSEFDNLTAISVLMATYARKNTSHIKFSLLTSDDQEVASQEVSATTIKDNSLYYFAFPMLTNSKGKTYHFKIVSPDAQSGNALTAWMNENENEINSGSELLFNNTHLTGSLILTLYYK